MDSRKLALYNWQDAVKEEGQNVMYQVTTRLYTGGSLRPDLYLRHLHRNDQIFRTHFTSDQQEIIKSYDQPTNYNIQTAAKCFDISLHWAVQRKVCGLRSSDMLYEKLIELVALRNKDSHRTDHNGISINELSDQLLELLELCMDILNILEERTGDLTKEKNKIKNGIKGRLNGLGNTDQLGMAMHSKVAIGVGVAGAGILALGALASHLSDRSQNKKDESNKNRTSSNKEECNLM